MADKQQAVPKFPEENVWRELVKGLKLNVNQADELEHAIKYALRDLKRRADKYPDRAGRRALVARLKRFQTALQGLIDDVRDEPARLKEILPRESHFAMGLWLADESMRREKLAFDDRTDPNEQRKDRGLDDGLKMLTDALTEIKAPIDKWTADDKPDPGGVEPNLVRETLITYLADKAEAIIGRRAAATAKGPFENLCTHVLDACLVGSDGLKDAIERTLRKRRADLKSRGFREP